MFVNFDTITVVITLLSKTAEKSENNVFSIERCNIALWVLDKNMSFS